MQGDLINTPDRQLSCKDPKGSVNKILTCFEVIPPTPKHCYQKKSKSFLEEHTLTPSRDSDFIYPFSYAELFHSIKIVRHYAI
jgi:hypothetical protein